MNTLRQCVCGCARCAVECQAGNAKSVRVMEKIGLKKLVQTYAYFKGVSHLSDYYALTSAEFLRGKRVGRGK